jgi:hypothetical protein
VGCDVNQTNNNGIGASNYGGGGSL